MVRIAGALNSEEVIDDDHQGLVVLRAGHPPSQADNPSVTVATPTPSRQSETIRNHAVFFWSVADLLRGDYKQSGYGKVILPLTVIRRLDCVLEPTKQAVLKKHRQLAGRIENVEPVLQGVTHRQFYNTSKSRRPAGYVVASSISLAGRDGT